MWGMPLHRMAVAWGDPDLRADLSPTPFFPLLRVVPEELFMTEQKRAAVEYTQEELETMVKAVLNGSHHRGRMQRLSGYVGITV